MIQICEVLLVLRILKKWELFLAHPVYRKKKDIPGLALRHGNCLVKKLIGRRFNSPIFCVQLKDFLLSF